MQQPYHRETELPTTCGLHATKEKEMEPKHHDCTTIGCDELTWGVEPKVCTVCIEKRTATLRAVWGRAYFAALTGASYHIEEAEGAIVATAQNIANATISAWPAMTAERDAIIANAVKS